MALCLPTQLGFRRHIVLEWVEDRIQRSLSLILIYKISSLLHPVFSFNYIICILNFLFFFSFFLDFDSTAQRELKKEKNVEIFVLNSLLYQEIMNNIERGKIMQTLRTMTRRPKFPTSIQTCFRFTQKF